MMSQTLRFEHIHFSYPGKQAPALSDLNLEILPGSIHALLGPNGAGKTTLLRLLCNRLGHSYQGQIYIPQAWQNPEGLLDAARYGVLIENPGIYARMSVREYLGFFGGFYHRNDLDERMHDLAARLQLANLDVRMASLSLGMRQKVQIIRTLLHDPDVVLLDEPSSNLDPISREEVWALVHQYHELGTTFIICSHILGELEQHCTHASFIASGQIRASGSLNQLWQNAGEQQIQIRLSAPCTEQPGTELLRAWQVNHWQVCEREIQLESAVPERTNPLVVQWLVSRQMQVVEVLIHRPTLADFYRRHVENS